MFNCKTHSPECAPRSSTCNYLRTALTFLLPLLLSFGVQADDRLLPVMGRVVAESSAPQWPLIQAAAKGSPNVVVILTDDVGFSAASTFGGPVPTPTFEALAQSGLRYTTFHTTALCSPTRAALLTGRNHHEVGMGVVEEQATGYPGYTGFMPASAATIAQILKKVGFSTALFGKWHLVPYAEMSQNGPFDRWPIGKGFEHFYGFLGGETNQWAPTLWEDTHPIEPARGDKNYILDRDLADRASQWIRMQKAVNPDKPFFLYYAPGATHAPIQAPPEWVAKFKGQFDGGWDKLRQETFERQKKLGIIPSNADLTARPKVIPAWQSLSRDRQKLYANMMEVYAGMLAYSDNQIGRVIETLKDVGAFDNTLIIFVQGDNGASAEGGENGYINHVNWANGITEDFETLQKNVPVLGSSVTYLHYPAGWAHAMSTPFQWYKQAASHLGGTRNGMVISWPVRIRDKGGIRTQFHHVTDIVPTILEATGVPAPTDVDGVHQIPIEGVSMVYTFDKAAGPSHRTRQYFEIFGNRGIYQEGWMAASKLPFQPWEIINRPSVKLEDQSWELYDLSNDFSEAHDVAKKFPNKLRELEDAFWIEAARNSALPLLLSAQDSTLAKRPDPRAGRNEFVYFPGMTRIPSSVAVNVVNKSYVINVDVDIYENNADGVLVTMGDRFSGFSFFISQGKLMFCYNVDGQQRTNIESSALIMPGKHMLVAEFVSDGGIGKGGTLSMKSDSKLMAQGRIERTVSRRFALDASLSVGEAVSSPVSNKYEVPFQFRGKIEKVTFKLLP